MRKIPMLSLFLLLALTAYSEPSEARLNAILDPNMGLRELADAMAKNQGNGISKDKYYLLVGRCSGLVDRSEEGGEFFAECELIGGEWLDMENVRSFKVFLSFNGSEYANLVDSESGEWLKPGALVVVIGGYVGSRKEYGGEKDIGIIRVQRLVRIE